MDNYIVGVDIGGTSIKIGCFNEEGVLAKKWSIPTRTENNGAHILSDIAVSIDSEMNEQHISIENINGIGIGVPGPIINDSVVNKCVNLGWGVKDVAAELTSLINIRNIKVANDSNAAALGELWKGAGEGHHNACFVTIGTGIGAGLIINDAIVPGAFGAGGEIGHIHINDNETQLCSCGGCGCVEQYAAAPGILRKCRKLLSESPLDSVLREIPELTVKDIFDYAKRGDIISMTVVDYCADALSRALACVSNVADPEIFILGGGVSNAGDILIDAVQNHFRHYAFHASRKAKFRLAELGNDAGIFGLAKLVSSQV